MKKLDDAAKVAVYEAIAEIESQVADLTYWSNNSYSRMPICIPLRETLDIINAVKKKYTK